MLWGLLAGSSWSVVALKHLNFGASTEQLFFKRFHGLKDHIRSLIICGLSPGLVSRFLDGAGAMCAVTVKYSEP